MEDVETQYYVGWLYSSVVTKEGFHNLSYQLRIVAFLSQTMNWSQTHVRFLEKTINVCCGIHMCQESYLFIYSILIGGEGL